MPKSPTQQLVDLRLGNNLEGLVAEAREKHLSWRALAAQITKTSGIYVSHETLRNWFMPAA